MLDRLGRLVVRHRIRLLAATVVLVVCAGLFGREVAQRLTSGGFDDPHSASARATALLHTRFHTGEPNFVLVVTALGGKGADDPAVSSTGTALTAQLGREPHVQQVVSYWLAGRPAALRSSDGRSVLVLARLTGNDSQVNRYAGELEP